MSEGFDAREFLAGYLAETEEHLGRARTHLMALDEAARRGESSPRAVRELFRSLHTIKGLSAMVGVEPIVDVAHALESLLRAADEGGGRLSPETLDLVLSAVGAIESRVRAAAEERPVPTVGADLLDALAAATGSVAPPGVATDPASAIALDPAITAKLGASEWAQLGQAPARGFRAVRIDFVPSPSRAEQGVNITRVRERLAALGEVVKIVPLATESAQGGLKFAILLVTGANDAAIGEAAGADPGSVETVLAAAARRQRPESELDPEDASLGPRQMDRFVRVDVARLDDALDRLSALVVTRFRLERGVAEMQARGADVRGLIDIVRENGRQLRALRTALMRARTVPMSDLLGRIPLIVRGLRGSTGKSVQVEMHADRAELDKTVAERIFPAIVHIVRNAVDHGIEGAEERRRAGKPEEGRIRIDCAERSNNKLELTISDDGRGVDVETLARRAGREPPGTEAGLLALLAQPGLSSAETATRTSGRGLGMDIVKRSVEELGGTLQLRTRPGEGTSFTLRLPLSITILEAFSLECGDQRFVVPVAMVEEFLDIDTVHVVNVPPTPSAPDGVRLVQRRGRAMPLFALARIFGRPAGRAPHRKALVVERNGEPFAFEVDRTLGQQEVVVRPLEDPLVRVPGISGSTDLGDGKPTLVLDLVALSAEMSRAGEGLA